MKTKWLFFVVLFVLSVPLAFAQEIPKGDVIAEPALSTIQVPDSAPVEIVSGIAVHWQKDTRFNATLDDAGVVTNLFLMVGEVMYCHPTKDGYDKKFSNLESWKRFAAELRQRFYPLGDGLYVEREPYEVVGIAGILIGMEGPFESLILKRESRFVSIDCE